MSRRASKVTEIPAFTLSAGQRPVPDARDPSGAMVLRGWQAEGYAALSGASLRILLAPTGSGKSTLIKALAAEELRDPRVKTVIAVPQVVIARSFGDVPQGIRCGEHVATWQVGHNLVDGSGGAVDALIAFVRGKPAASSASRTLVCSHQTLVIAHRRMTREAKGKRSPWAGVSLFIDEAHHSRAEDADDSGERAEQINNRLGQLVTHWLDRKPGSLLLATATWLRANLSEIVPAGRMGDFTKYILTMDEHLARMNHLREVAFRFIIGAPDDSLRAIYAEGNAKTIAWLPNVNSQHVKALGGKHSALEAFEGAIGDVVGVDDWTTTLQHKPAKGRRFDVRTLDFVTLEGRDDRRRALEAAILQGADATPDLLWALGMGKEGFDWPELSRAIVIGERGSIPDVLQMMGRTMRDYPGKARAEFNMVLPYVDDPENVRAYLKVILASMVIESGFGGGWPWQSSKRDDSTSSASGDVDALSQAAEVIDSIVDRAIRDPKAEATPDAVIDAALSDAGVPEDERDEARGATRRMFTDWTRRLAEIGDVPVDVSESVLGCVRMLGLRFGFKTLADLREALGQKPNLTEEQILEWAEEHKAKTGEWPDQYSGAVHGHDETWAAVSAALRQGLRGMPGGSSIPMVIGLETRARTTLTESQILAWAEEHRKMTGKWPNQRTGAVHGHTWKNIDKALRDGFYGLSGGSSLSRLLGRTKHDMSEAQILAWADEHKARTGKLPTTTSGLVQGRDGQTWTGVDQALRVGARGLPGGSSLSKLLASRSDAAPVSTTKAKAA